MLMQLLTSTVADGSILVRSDVLLEQINVVLESWVLEESNQRLNKVVSVQRDENSSAGSVDIDQEVIALQRTHVVLECSQ